MFQTPPPVLSNNKFVDSNRDDILWCPKWRSPPRRPQHALQDIRQYVSYRKVPPSDRTLCARIPRAYDVTKRSSSRHLILNPQGDVEVGEEAISEEMLDKLQVFLYSYAPASPSSTSSRQDYFVIEESLSEASGEAILNAAPAEENDLKAWWTPLFLRVARQGPAGMLFTIVHHHEPPPNNT